MRTGKVAKILGVDPKTIINWTDAPELVPFFTQGAKGIGLTQRHFSDDDLMVLNTIRSMRTTNRPWDEIAGAIADGTRIKDLPDSALTVESSTPILQYAKIAQLNAQLESAQRQVSELQQQVAALRRENEDMHKTLGARVERLLREAAEREGKLHREIGKLEAIIDMLRDEPKESPSQK